MDNKKILTIFLVLLLVIIFILLTIFSCKKEHFENKYSSQDLIDMFNSLEVAEKRCNEIEERQKIEEDKEQLDKNEKAFNELEELDKKINELKEIVRDLTIEKTKRDQINNKCQNQKQIKLNQNYNLLNKLNDENLVSDNSINLDLNISDHLNLNNLKNNKNKLSNSECKNPNPKKYIGTNDIKKCVGCDVKKLKKNKFHINKDFK